MLEAHLWNVSQLTCYWYRFSFPIDDNGKADGNEGWRYCEDVKPLETGRFPSYEDSGGNE